MSEVLEKLELSKDDFTEMRDFAAHWHGHCSVKIDAYEDKSDDLHQVAVKVYKVAQKIFAASYYWFRDHKPSMVSDEELCAQFRAFLDGVWLCHNAEDSLGNVTAAHWSLIWQLEEDAKNLFPNLWKARYK